MTTLDGLEADAPASIRTVTIVHARAVTYRVPTDDSEARKTNFVIDLDGRIGTQHVLGVGECQPRGRRTGDDAGDAWAFLQEVLRRCEGAELGVTTAAEAISSVRALMREFSELARHCTDDPRRTRPFRGTLLGVEIALLDLVARISDLTLAELLGQARDAAPAGPKALSVGMPPRRVRRRLNTQAETYDLVRITGTADVGQNRRFLELAAAANRDPQIARPHKPLWIDLNGGLDREQAEQLVDDVVRAAAAARLPSTVLIEQPIPMEQGSGLAPLQRRAERRSAQLNRPDLDIRIVADESMWDAASPQDLDDGGALGAVNIRPAQAGGLLAALDLAWAAVERNPGTMLFVTRMTGASQLTAAALRHLALALPRIDAAYVSATVENRFSVTRAVRDPAAQAAPAAQTTHAAHPAHVASAAELVTASPVAPSRAGGSEEAEAEQEEAAEFAGAPPADGQPEDTGTAGQTAVMKSAPPAPAPQRVRRTDQTDSTRNGARLLGVGPAAGMGLRVDYPGLVNQVRDSLTYPPPPAPVHHGVPANVYDDVEHLYPLGPNGAKGHLLEREALALGLSTERFSKGAFTATDGEQVPISFKWSRNPLSSAVALALCTHKEATRIRLRQAGLPVPQGRTFAAGDTETAAQFAEMIGYPVVVKPAMGVRGIGVVAGIGDAQQLEAAFGIMTDSKLGEQDFIVEKHITGADYRILVVDGHVVAAIRRDPASVVGDGRSTIAELLIAKNAARRRNPHLWARPARHDAAAQYELAMAGRTLDTVLPWGEQQVLANTCSLSQGGDSTDVLDELHPSITEACVQAVEAVPGMQYCGVDFLLEDHTRPLDEQDAGICELNAHAAIGNCEYPMFGTPRPVARALMQAGVEHYGLQAGSVPAEQVALHVTVRGRVTSVGYRRWVQRRAEAAGLTGWVRNLAARRVEVVLVGPTTAATALASALVLGPARAQPTSYQAEHITAPEPMEGFCILPDAQPSTEAAPARSRRNGLLRVLGL